MGQTPKWGKAQEGKRTMERRLWGCPRVLGRGRLVPPLPLAAGPHQGGPSSPPRGAAPSSWRRGKAAPSPPYIKRPPREEENIPGLWLTSLSPILFFLRSSLLEHARG